MVCGEDKNYEVWIRRETESEQGASRDSVDPKPYDLSMSRLKTG